MCLSIVLLPGSVFTVCKGHESLCCRMEGFCIGHRLHWSLSEYLFGIRHLGLSRLVAGCICPCPNTFLRIAMLTWVRNFVIVMMANAKKTLTKNARTSRQLMGSDVSPSLMMATSVMVFGCCVCPDFQLFGFITWLSAMRIAAMMMPAGLMQPEHHVLPRFLAAVKPSPASVPFLRLKARLLHLGVQSSSTMWIMPRLVPGVGVRHSEGFDR
jgi:hypothetical protein